MTFCCVIVGSRLRDRENGGGRGLVLGAKTPCGGTTILEDSEVRGASGKMGNGEPVKSGEAGYMPESKADG
jgi:hypothetical protein